jgi:transposase
MPVSKYTEEFRADAVAMCERGDRSIRKVSIDLGINHWTLRDWITRYAMAKKSRKGAGEAVPGKESLAEKAKRLEREVDRLKRENQRLEQDREILKKAAAFFAKESE